ncbi:MAG: PAS domain S-box protein, partial [Verrucomicrobiaceae bacterium]
TAEQVRLVVFLLIGIGASVIFESMHRAGRRERTGAIRLAAEVEERRRVEAAVRESEERFRLLVEGVRDYAIFMLDPKGEVASWNRGAEKLVGYSTGEILGRHFSIFYPPEQVAEGGPQRELEIASQEGRYEGEGERVRKDGSRFSALVVVTALYDELGQVRGFSEITRDITPWIKTRKALKESEAQLNQALQAGRLGRWTVDLRNLHVHQDAQAARLLGLPTEETMVKAEAFHNRLHPEDRFYIESAITEAVQGTKGYDVEFRVIHSSEVRWLAAKGDVVRAESGEPSQMAGVIFDITDRKKIEAALREADRRKDQFLAMLGHELRNPLAAIRNALEVGLKSEESHPWALEVIERQSGRLSRLVDALLDTSRIARGKIELQREPLDLATVLDHAVETVQPLIDEKKHTLHQEYNRSRGALRMSGDPMRLEQVIANLLTNAIKYTPPGGEIWLTARRESGDPADSSATAGIGSSETRESDTIVVRIRDTGVGILPEYIPVMFEIFTQTERELARSEGGLGLGLSIVRHLVEMHGGTVGGHSEGLGKGSEFIVRLPIGKETPSFAGTPVEENPSLKENVASPETESAGTNGAKRVLVVDDNEDAAWGLWKLVKRWGYTVDLAFDGEAGLEKVRAFRPDVVLLDIGLPGRNGYEVAREIHAQERFRSTRLIAITGYNQED